MAENQVQKFDEEVNIGLDETVEINALSTKTAETQVNSQSTKHEVAELRSGKYILGLSEGTAYITVTYNNVTKVYKVNVTNKEEEKRKFGKFNDIDEEYSSYIGAGYNVITSGYMNDNSAILNNPVFNQKKIAASGELSIHTANEITNIQISGDSMENFMENYSSKLGVNVSGGYKKSFSASADTSFSFVSKSSMTGKTSINKFYALVQTQSLYFTASETKYHDYLNDGVLDVIEGKTGLSVADVIERYGTHVIMSAAYGGRLDFDYVLSSTDKNTTTSDVTNIAASLSTSFSSFSAKADGKYDRSYETDAKNKNVRIQTQFSVHGGNRVAMTSIDNVIANYNRWMDTVEDKPTLIGVTNAASLYPIWNLLPETYEGKARRQEFINYVCEQLENSYDAIISPYFSMSINEKKTLRFGEYPQSRAPLSISSELAAGKGEWTGEKFCNNDVLEYKGKRYLEYRCINNPAPGYTCGETYYFLIEKLPWSYYGTDGKGQKLYTCDLIIDGIAEHYDSVGNWVDSNLRTVLNNNILPYAFTTKELDKLGLVYYSNTHEAGKNAACSDYMQVAPFTTASLGNKEMVVSDFAYCRGVEQGRTFWASRSDFIIPTRYGYKHGEKEGEKGEAVPVRYVFDGDKSCWYLYYGWDMAGLKPTIAIK